MRTDEEVRVPVISLSRRVPGFYLTPEGRAVLAMAESEPIPREAADAARALAMQRRDQQIAGGPPASL